MKYIAISVLTLALMACSPEPDGLSAGVVMQEAEQGAAKTLAGSFAEADIQSVANCLADNAYSGEIERFAAAYRAGDVSPVKGLAQEILTRAETRNCIVDNKVALT